MERKLPKTKPECKTETGTRTTYREQLPAIAEEIIGSCSDAECYLHVDYEPIPSRASVIEIINRFREIMFPGYFSREKLDPVNLQIPYGAIHDGTF